MARPSPVPEWRLRYYPIYLPAWMIDKIRETIPEGERSKNFQAAFMAYFGWTPPGPRVYIKYERSLKQIERAKANNRKRQRAYRERRKIEMVNEKVRVGVKRKDV